MGTIQKIDKNNQTFEVLGAEKPWYAWKFLLYHAHHQKIIQGHKKIIKRVDKEELRVYNITINEILKQENKNGIAKI